MNLRSAYAYFTGEAGRHVLARAVYLRGLAVVYAMAFTSLGVQLRGLVGEGGIDPATRWLALVRDRLGAFDGVLQVPTLFWLSASDAALVSACGAGAALSVLVLAGVAMRWVLFAQWALYLSLMNVGGVFLGYQWDTLLLEAGLLSVLLAPAGRWPEREGGLAPARWAVILLMFLLVRLMILAGLVKLFSGDPTWRDLSVLDYHYWTQPLPNGLSFWAAQLPPALQRISVAVMLLVELGAPLLLLFRGWPRRVGAACLMGLQVLILLTGNYGFFNYLSIALCLLMLDDDVWRRVLPERFAQWARRAGRSREGAPGAATRAAGAGLAIVLLLLSAWVAFGRLVRPSPPAPLAWVLQKLAPFNAINAYGLFAMMTTTRPEIVVEGSADGRTWRAYEFRYKPGRLDRRPPSIAPHQPRLDWQMWFAALGSCRQNPWFLQFQRRLLEARPEVLGLLETDPFAGRPPRFVRSTVYAYRFTSTEERNRTGAYWTRVEKGPYCPPLMLVNGQLQAAP